MISTLPSLEPSPPHSLYTLQLWFGQAITTPLAPDHCLAFQEETSAHIRPTPHLSSHQCLEIYHQQYWWRLLRCLRENCPFVLRLFGEIPFEREIAIPYLSHFPPSHWSLSRLGERLSLWVETHYAGPDALLVAQAAALDWAAQKALWSPSLPPLQATDSAPLSQYRLGLQPFLSLFALSSDLFSCREHLLKEDPSYWTMHPFPSVEHRSCFFVVYRTSQFHVAWKEISFAAYQVLLWIQKGILLSDLVSLIEGRGGALLEEAEVAFPLWFRTWTSWGWLTPSLP